MSTATRRCFVLSLVLFLTLRALHAADTGTITGTVTDPDGKPIAGAVVTLTPARGAGSGGSVTATSNKDGAFRAEGLTLGEWNFSVKAPGYYEKKTWEPVSGGGQRLRIHPGVVLAPSNSNGTVALTLRPVSVLYGRVVTADGKPVVNQRLWFVYEFSTLVGQVAESVQCDAFGFYRHVLPYEGENKFGAFHEGSGQYLPLTTFTYVGGKQTRHDIRLVRGASVSGRVVAADGRTPVEGASIGAEYDSLEGGSPAFSAVVTNYGLDVDWGHNARSGADGSFRLPVNPGMTYTLRASTAEYCNVDYKAPKVRLRDGVHRAGFKLVLDDRKIVIRFNEHRRTGHPR